MEDWILERFRIIVSLPWEHITGRIAIIKDGLSSRFEENITTIKNSL